MSMYTYMPFFPFHTVLLKYLKISKFLNQSA